MWNPFAKLFEQSDLEKSADLVAELERHVATWPAIEREFFELDKKCCEISHRLDAARNCGSPTVPALYRELTAASSARDRGKGWFTVEQNRLRCQIERLTAPAIRAFHEQCSTWMKQAYAQRRANVLERYSDPVTLKELARISHNLGVVKEAQAYIGRMQSEVGSMMNRPLAEIEAKIAEVTAKVALFDFDKLESDDEWISASFIPDFMAESVSADIQYDRVFLSGATWKGSGGWQANRIGE